MAQTGFGDSLFRDITRATRGVRSAASGAVSSPLIGSTLTKAPAKAGAAAKGVVVRKPKVTFNPTGVAQSTVQQSLAPLLESLHSQQGQLSDFQHSQNQDLEAFTNRLLGYITGIPQQVGANYDQMINTTNNLAQTAATGLANLNPNPGVQADLAAIGAPQAQRDALAAQNQQVFGGGAATLYDTSGKIPATQMAENKNSTLDFYAGLPAVFGLQGVQALKQLSFLHAKDQTALQNKIAEIEAKRPGLVQEALAAMQDATLKQQQAKSLADYRKSQAEVQLANAKTNADYKAALVNLEAAKAQQDAAYRQGQLKLGAAKIGQADKKLGLDAQYKAGQLDLGKTKAQQDAEYKAGQLALGNRRADIAALNASLSKVKIISGKNGSIQKVDPVTGAVTQLAPPGTTGKQSQVSSAARQAQKKYRGLTPYQYKNVVAKAEKVAPELYAGKRDSSGKVVSPPAKDYSAALFRLMRSGLLLKDAQEIVNQYWDTPGEDGRPLISFQDRQKLYRAFPEKRKMIDAAMWDPELAAQFGVLIGG